MKRVLWTLVIALSFAIAASTPALAFTDISGSWAEDTIQKWKDEGRVSGYPDGTFQPNASITRAELISMISPLFGFSASVEIQFSDVNAAAWYFDNVSAAVAAGIINGYPDGTFGPNEQISRQEIAVIVMNVLGISSAHQEVPFVDAAEIPAWSAASIVSAYEHGLMSGSGTGAFRPADSATRAEAVVLLERAFRLWAENAGVTRTLDHAGTFGPSKGVLYWDGDLTITSPNVVLRNIVIGGDLIAAAPLDESDISLEGVTVIGETKFLSSESDEEEPVQQPDPDESSEDPAEQEQPTEPGDEPGETEEPTEPGDEPGETEEPTEPGEEPGETEEPTEPGDEPGETEEPTEPGDEPGETEEPTEPGDEPGETEEPSEEQPEPEPTEPLVVLSASASIGGSSVSASMDGNSGRVSASSFDDSDQISGFSIQASDNVDRVEVSAFGISRTVTLTNGSGSISVSDILGPLGDGVTMGAVRQMVGNSFSIGGTLIGKQGQEESFDIQISL